MTTPTNPQPREVLKPCPFCGVNLKVFSEAQGYWHPRGNCPLADFEMAADGYSEKRWNTRQAAEASAHRDQSWFFRSAIEAAIGFAPEGRRLVVCPFHQSIRFNERPSLHPDREWELLAPFKYLAVGDPVPDGWLEGSALLAPEASAQPEFNPDYVSDTPMTDKLGRPLRTVEEAKKVLRPKPETIKAIEKMEQASALGLAKSGGLLVGASAQPGEREAIAKIIRQELWDEQNSGRDAEACADRAAERILALRPNDQSGEREAMRKAVAEARSVLVRMENALRAPRIDIVEREDG